MDNKWVAFISGLLFGVGLLISGMADPAKVIGFLDLKGLFNGSWDPSLILVMLGALLVYMPVFHCYIKPRLNAVPEHKATAICGSDYHLPVAEKPNRRLIIGAGLFGIGWGIAGICPGPALVNIGSLDISLALFIISMLTGIYMGQLSQRYLNSHA
ncbi:YeeE/YedE family protein [Shewanella sp. VB17]|uniref:YeeE/YedE family protein n=1 Tax=Shewanella sp. VB17 TaxID=2739432 RepID=UPI001565821D|nr:YeeE/YedE family protein [Shewanella sp. VB17]NRD73029.1 YeeE/YedE family protein [Shewanella sp. VB17]